MEKMIRNLNSLCEVPNLNNAQNVNFGWKEFKDVVQWLVDVGMSFVMIVEVVTVHMECVKMEVQVGVVVYLFLYLSLEEEEEEDVADDNLHMFILKCTKLQKYKNIHNINTTNSYTSVSIANVELFIVK